MGKSIKETKELLEGIKELVKLGKDVRDMVKDGVGSEDLVKGFEIIKEQADKLEIYKAAFDGVKEIEGELKDLDKEEIIQLIMIVINGVSEVEKA